MKENIELQNIKKDMAKTEFWHPMLDVELKNNFEVIMTKNIVTLDSMVMEIIGDENKWSLPFFEKYYTFLENVKTHIKNLVTITTAKNFKSISEKLSFDAMCVFDQKIEARPIANKAKILVFALDGLVSTSSLSIFDAPTTSGMVTEEFINKLKALALKMLNEKKFINILDKFIIGLDAKGTLVICNTPKGIMDINKNQKIDLEVSDIPFDYIKK